MQSLLWWVLKSLRKSFLTRCDMAASSSDVSAVIDLIKRSQVQGQRLLAAIVGPPGSGKSTLAEAVVDRLNADASEQAALVPMDGYHLDNQELVARGLLQRKGAPATFDAESLLELIRLISLADRDIRYPTFDRNLDATVPNGALLNKEIPLVVLEGNYLLLDKPIWRQLKPLFDVSVFLKPSRPELERRLIDRWLHYGFSPEEARRKALGNDMVNADLVLTSSLQADLCLTQASEQTDPAAV